MHVSHRSAIEQMQTLMRGLEVENTRLRQRVDALTAQGKERAGETTPLRAGQHAALLLRIAELEAATEPAVSRAPIGAKVDEAITHLDRIREQLWHLHEEMAQAWHTRLLRWARHRYRAARGFHVPVAAGAVDLQIDGIDRVTDHLIELRTLACPGGERAHKGMPH